MLLFCRQQSGGGWTCKHNSGKQPTVDFSHKPIQRSGVKHSVWEVIPPANLSRQKNILQTRMLYTSISQTLMDEQRQLLEFVELW